MSSIYIPTSNTSGSVTKDYVDQSIQPLAYQLGTATSSNTASAIVKRDGTGGFDAGTIKASSLEVSGTTKLAMPLKDSTGTNILNIVSENTHVGKDISSAGTLNTAVGSRSLRSVTDAMLNTAIGVGALEGLTTGTHNVAIGYRTGSVGTVFTTGTKCVLIGADARTSSSYMENSAAIGYTAVVDANNTIQLGNPGITAVKTSGTLYAAGLESIGTNSTLTIAGSDNTKVVEIGKGTGVQTINIGNSGGGATTINIGSGLDTVNISGTLNNITTTNTQVTDKTLVLNSGGTASTAGSAGIYFEEAGSSANSYVRVSSDRSKMELKAPTGSLISFNQSLLTTDSPLFKQVYCNAFDMSTTPLTGAAFMAWNRESGSGRTVFATQQGGGTGGWEWMNYKNDNTVYNPNPQMTLDRDGNLAVTGIVRSSGLTLPNAGGTAYGSTLNHYEEYSAQMKFNNTVVETPLLNYQIVRIGKQVTFTIKEGVLMTSSSTGEFMTMNTNLIPSRFLPTHTIPFPIIIIKNNTRSVGKVVIDMSDSKLHILGAGTVNFTIGESNGFEPFSITYLI